MRFTGYASEFDTAHCTRPWPRSCTSIEAVVLVFGQPRYAQARFAAACLRCVAPLRQWRSVALGAEARETRHPLLSSLWGLYEDEEQNVLLFRRGPVLVLVFVAGPRGTTQARSPEKYARIIDGRIQRALRQ